MRTHVMTHYCLTEFFHSLICIVHHVGSQVKPNCCRSVESYNSNSGPLWFGRHSILFDDRLHELNSSSEVRFSDACRTVENEHKVESGSTRGYSGSGATVYRDQTEFVDQILS